MKRLVLTNYITVGRVNNIVRKIRKLNLRGVINLAIINGQMEKDVALTLKALLEMEDNKVRIILSGDCSLWCYVLTENPDWLVEHKNESTFTTIGETHMSEFITRLHNHRNIGHDHIRDMLFSGDLSGVTPTKSFIETLDNYEEELAKRELNRGTGFFGMLKSLFN